MTGLLTDAQQRALLYLPADGAWSGRAPRAVSSALQSLWLYHLELVEFRQVSTRNGVYKHLEYRLTAAGQVKRAALDPARGDGA